MVFVFFHDHARTAPTWSTVKIFTRSAMLKMTAPVPSPHTLRATPRSHRSRTGGGSRILPPDRSRAPPRPGRPHGSTPPLRGRATPAADARHDRERRMAKGDGA